MNIDGIVLNAKWPYYLSQQFHLKGTIDEINLRAANKWCAVHEGRPKKRLTNSLRGNWRALVQRLDMLNIWHAMSNKTYKWQKWNTKQAPSN